MKAVIQRVDRLEKQLAPAVQPDFIRYPRKHLRIVATVLGRVSSELPTCLRTLTASGCLSEIVHLNGSRDRLSEEDLEQFIQSFPVERI